MPRDIISINSTHYVGNNLYRLKLPKAVEFKKGDKLSLYSFSMYNSFYNISQSQYQNTNITFTWFNGDIYNWTIPDGYYSLSDLNLWLQQRFILNKLYCVNSNNSQNIYFVRFQTIKLKLMFISCLLVLMPHYMDIKLHQELLGHFHQSIQWLE